MHDQFGAFGLSRREFLALGAVGTLGLTTHKASTNAATALADRGVPTEYSGAALPRIGMPVGGGCCGQVYLAGDGRLWAWDIFNPPAPLLGGAAHGGPHYANPVTAATAPPFRQGFAIRTEQNGTVQTRTLDSTGFSDVRFVGQYPIGKVTYRAPDCPVEVGLDAFSPFIPLNTDDSTLPATMLVFTVRNPSASSVRISMLGFAENPVCVESRRQQATTLRARSLSASDLRGVLFDASVPGGPSRPDVVFEDWERETYDGWTTTGTAFGPGPVPAAGVPDYMRRGGDLNVSGTRFVTSHNYRAHPGDIGAADAHEGTLTSPAFTVERRYVTVSVGGGNHAGQTCVNVLVDGQVVATATGADVETLTARVLDVSAYQGRTARIQIVDSSAGAWGHVNVDAIVFSDRADVVFEDWEHDDYGGWTVTGNAFGSGPVRPLQVPALMRRFGDLNVSGTRFVSSYNYRLDGPDPDAHQGTLTSPSFRISRKYVSVAIGGGNRPGVACVNVLVGGQVVASATGADSEPMVPRLLDVSAYQGRTAQLQVVDSAAGAWGHVNVDEIVFTDSADILFEDWERTSYTGWTVTGTAFGTRPVTPAEMPEGFRRPFGEITDLNVSGSRFVTSYLNGSSPDAHQGTLTSGPFTIQRAYVTAWVGGGRHAGKTCVNVLVGDQVVASASGSDIEPLRAISLDVEPWRGRSARIQIADLHTGDWGHVNVDRIVFSDRPVRKQPMSERTDGGSFVLAALDDAATVRPSIARWSTTAQRFDSEPGPAEVSGVSAGQAGAVTVTATLAAGESRTFRYLFGWHFPTPERGLFAELVGAASLRRHYAARFGDAGAVARYVAANAGRLESDTRGWVRTWYTDSSLPYWFCERTLATASTLATNTCYRWSDGRFYAFEGAYLYAGTCQHVWNYAQAIARLFPELERDTRERVDVGIALRPTGEMGNRGECRDDASSFVDGQAGTILRIYREHQMSADDAFLRRVWPGTRSALEFLVNQRDGNGDGILAGAQWNTLDTPFYGAVPWLSGLYVAALRAGAAMAAELSDQTLARRYATIAAAGSHYIDTQLWDQQAGYFVQTGSTNPAAMNTNRGCFIDQMYGQTYASQLGLPRVFPAARTRTALASLVRHNVLPNPAGSQSPSLPGGRVYSMPGEAGAMMCTWPVGGAESSGSQGPRGYLNEVWSGQEHQLAAHLFAEGLSDSGLAVTRAVYDRYHASKRNPYNEVEAGDHYARAMMSYGTYLAACGYEHHGPQGHLGFAPRVSPESFAAAFTAAAGWGLYRQTREPGRQTAVIEVRYGELRLTTMAFETPTPATAVSVRVAGSTHPATLTTSTTRAVVTFPTPATVTAGQSVEVVLTVT